MKVLCRKIAELIKLNRYLIGVIILSSFALLSYYFIAYSRNVYQVVTILILFIPVVCDVFFKVRYDKQNNNYYQIHNFALMRLYMIFVVPIFVGIHTNWNFITKIMELHNLAIITVYLLMIVLVNIFVLRYQNNEHRRSDKDNTINLIIYVLILGLVLIAR